MVIKVGDIVKFTGKDGEEVVGIVYENGNKTYGSFRVQVVEVVKRKYLEEEGLQPATDMELSDYILKALLVFTPEAIIARETEEAGGTLPEQITAAPQEDPEEEDDDDV